MREYRVQWTLCPTAYNPTRVLFVEAANSKDAETLARDHIERTQGVAGWIDFQVSESKPVPAGHIVGDK